MVYAASYGFSPEFNALATRTPIPTGRGTLAGRTLLEGRPVHIADVAADPEYTFEEAQRIGRFRAMLGVPLLRQGVGIGVIILTRKQPLPFTDKQIELVTTFADQAVIAIENTRLFEAEQQRTRELTEALGQQTATADMLKVISRSAFDLDAVLDTLTRSAALLCQAEMAGIVRPQDGAHYWVTAFNFPSAFMEFVRTRPILRDRGSVVGRALLEGRVVHSPDVLADPDFTYGEAQKLGGYRTVLGIPLLREGSPIGVIVLTRHEVQPFTERQIGVATTFADQAVIAIENVRLFEAEQQRTGRARRGARAADCDGRGAGRHLGLARRAGARIPGDPAQRDAHMRGEIRNPVPVRGWRSPDRVEPRHTTRFCRVPAEPDTPSRTAQPDQSRDREPRHSACGRLSGRPGVSRTRSSGDCRRRSWRHPDIARGADVEGRTADRRNRHLSPGNSSLRGQANRAGRQFRQAGRHCNREYPLAQRAARIPAAADRHRRRAQCHQPVELPAPTGIRRHRPDRQSALRG